MTELSIRPEEIRDALERFVSSYEPDEADEAEVGRVIETGDGIARVEGLHSTMTNELLEFGDGVLGIALNLDVREIGCVILGDAEHIEEGQEVRRTGEILSIPVGDGFLGRVVDPLGRPARRQGRHRGDRAPRPGDPGTDGRRAPAGEGAAADRHQGDRRHDGHRPRPAPAHHRRPADRQDRGRPRRDHQPARQLEERRPEEAGQVRLRRRSGRRARRSARSSTPSKRPARWSTRPSSARPRRSPPPSSTSLRTPARRSASTGCTRASTR